ncbi:MAG: hypothetical protein EOP36_01130 [Rubrivivax sp.]|nr:MAG: hypothetical protein EOP36_01130 [Rubrivivax sp.]
MTPSDQAPAPAPLTPTAPITPASHEHIRQEVAHLFRHSLRQGHINPLMHLVMAYRAPELP